MINTSGYQTRAMPVYSPVNPSLVAFNPNVAADGMMQAFQLAKQYEDIKSKKALQAELEATRQARIAQTNALANFDVARTGAETPTLMPKAGLQLAEIENKLALMPQERAARESDLLFSTAKNKAFMPNLDLLAQAENEQTKAGLRALEPVTNAKIDRAVADSANAQIESSTASQRQKATEAELKFKLTDLADKYANAESDAARKRAGADIDILLKNSQIAENLGRADYYGQGGSKKGVDPVAQLAKFHTMQSQVANEQKKVMDTMVPNPSGEGRVPFATYLAITRQPGSDQIGTERKMSNLFRATTKNTNSEGERLVRQLKGLSVQMDALQKHTSEYFNSGLMGDMGIETPAQKGPVVVKTKEEYARLAPGTEFVGEDGKKYVKPAR